MSMTELEHPAKHTAWSCRLGRGQAPPLRTHHVRQTVARLMKAEDLKDLRDKTLEELGEELVRLRKEQFHLRMQRASELLPQTHLLTQTRRDIARVKTLMQEKASA